jgi:hypothetical protein
MKRVLGIIAFLLCAVGAHAQGAPIYLDWVAKPVGYGQNEIVIHAIAGQPIQFSTFHGPSISPFNAYFTVIQE